MLDPKAVHKRLPDTNSNSSTAPAPSATILVVEDEAAVRSVVSRILRRWGYTVLEAASGSEALEMCRTFEKKIHLLLTDVIMPGMSGREVAEQVGKLRPGIQVIFMSGYTAEVIDIQVVQRDGGTFLQKPFTSGVLLEKIQDALSGH